MTPSVTLPRCHRSIEWRPTHRHRYAMLTQDSFPQCLSAVEATVARLLSFSTQPPRLNHEIPHKATSYLSIPIVEEIEEDLLRLHAISQSIDDATSWLGRWKLHIINASCPVSRLPPEILSNIFLLDSNASELDENDQAESAIRLSHVSRSWRAVALSLSALWSNISAEWTHAQQDVWLSRSRLHPLYLGIGFQYEASKMSPRVAENATRIHTVTASNLDLEGVRSLPIDYTLDPWIMTLPSLRIVNLSGINFALVEEAFDDLSIESFPWTELEITYSYLDARLLLKVLDACPELRKLMLVDLHCMSDQLDLVEYMLSINIISNTSLPHLTHLFIELKKDDDALMRILCRHMVAPSLISLTLEMDIPDQSPMNVESASNNVVGITQFVSISYCFRNMGKHQ